MTYIVAVSGGIDSVALLDMMVQAGREPLVVAHFDHGIRDDSAEDAKFVASLADRYGLPFETRREELGPNASEAIARERRYAFLRELASKYEGKIVTAHHADDLVETVAINLHRGTGWRGLAVLDSDVLRPLLDVHKDELRRYVNRRRLDWREDSTNKNDKYLRNKLRPLTRTIHPESKQRVKDLRRRQLELKKEIEAEVRRLLGDGPDYSRYLLTHMPPRLAVECLRVISNGTLTRPQLERLLLAVKTSVPGGLYHAGSGVTARFSTRYFTL